FGFFNELFLERADIDDVMLKDIYLDYEEHLLILKEIRKNYKELLSKDGYIDKFLIEDFRINEGLLEGVEEIEIRLDGYLSQFDIEVLKKIKKPIKIYFSVDRFNKPLLEKSFKLSLKEKEYLLDFHSNTLKEIKKEKKSPQIEVEAFSDRMKQIEFVFIKIAEFVESGISPDKIALILPDESFSEFLKLFDEYKNLNFAMGESFTRSPLYIKLKAIYDYLVLKDEVSFRKCKDYLEEFDRSDLIEFIRKNASERELKVIDEELFKLNAFRRFFKSKKEFLFFVLERLKEFSFDDVYSGRVTCMGVLESRGMEFEGVIVIDFNEEFVPRVSENDMFLNSFIRKHASLPTREDKENLQKHYYYSLFNNAKRVALSYIKNEDTSVSRFLYELEIKESETKDEKYKLFDYSSFEVAEYDDEFEVIEPIFPTELKTLIECPKRYYFSKVLNITQKDEKELFGNLFHKAIEEAVKNKDNINSINEYYDFIMEYLNNNASKKMKFDIFTKWSEKIKRFCEIDFEQMKYSQNLAEKTFYVDFEGKRLGMRIDRVDIKDKEVVLIDYKTSKDALKNENYVNEFQTTFYYLWAKKNFPGKEIKTFIWDLAEVRLIDGVLKIDELKEILNNLPKRVKEAEDIVYEVNGKERVKKASDICKFCDYKTACGREI
ncbi:MAG: PD-(D/E)XK nuclease family protein, partial [Nautiliaceae bacterium]